jgi:endonuclease/exonuclease/phosphatase family metal-dependent hydrolase
MEPNLVNRFFMLSALLFAHPALSADLKVATWNLDWLTTRAVGDPGLPTDVKPRADEDFARLARYAVDLNADVIAIQEVDGFRAATKIFPPDRYSIHMTRDHVMQRVGIVVRRGLKYDMNPDLTALGANHLRSGADITVHFQGSDLRVLAVHLKTGCRNLPLSKAHDRSCLALRDQVPIVAAWISDRVKDGTPFIILGDFNRWMDGRDSLLAELRQAGPLARATEGHSSPCWGAENFIDHILAGGVAAKWMQADTLKVMIYRETDKALKDRLSDHCPVSIRFAVPD